MKASEVLLKLMESGYTLAADEAISNANDARDILTYYPDSRADGVALSYHTVFAIRDPDATFSAAQELGLLFGALDAELGKEGKTRVERHLLQVQTGGSGEVGAPARVDIIICRFTVWTAASPTGKLRLLVGFESFGNPARLVMVATGILPGTDSGGTPELLETLPHLVKLLETFEEALRERARGKPKALKRLCHLNMAPGDNVRLHSVPTKTAKYKIPEALLYPNVKVREKLRRAHQALQQAETGLVLLHGKPGTGKTSWIRSLTHTLKNRLLVYLPPSIAMMLNDIRGGTDARQIWNACQRDYGNDVTPILVIEDAEVLIESRTEGGHPFGVSGLLNLTDGLLGDITPMPVICTFNASLDDIDSALLRAGRLIAEVKFEEHTAEQAGEIFEHVYKSQPSMAFKAPVTYPLAEIIQVLDRQKEIRASQKRAARSRGTSPTGPSTPTLVE